MTPLTVELETILDYGPLVSLMGKDLATGKPVAVHLDFRPLPYPPGGLRPAPKGEPVRLVAFGLTVGVDFGFAADISAEPGTVPLVDPARRPAG